MSHTPLYIDVHVLQTIPPSCVNRDDTGAPKQCVFGGVRRARVSSQAWKRAVRLAFREMYAPEDLANRTKNIVGMVAEKITELDGTIDSNATNLRELPSLGSNAINKVVSIGELQGVPNLYCVQQYQHHIGGNFTIFRYI